MELFFNDWSKKLRAISSKRLFFSSFKETYNLIFRFLKTARHPIHNIVLVITEASHAKNSGRKINWAQNDTVLFKAISAGNYMIKNEGIQHNTKLFTSHGSSILRM